MLLFLPWLSNPLITLHPFGLLRLADRLCYSGSGSTTPANPNPLDFSHRTFFHIHRITRPPAPLRASTWEGDNAMVESSDPSRLCTELVDPASPLLQEPRKIHHIEQLGHGLPPDHKRKLELENCRVGITAISPLVSYQSLRDLFPFSNSLSPCIFPD